MAQIMRRDQHQDVQRLYNERSAAYDDSWHPRFARHIVELAAIRPGEEVLDLACGTGLVTFLASDAVGITGGVVGIDLSSGMLSEATKKQSQRSARNVSFYNHSITELDSLPELSGRKFDAISCASALVLLSDPAGAIKHWVRYLKPGGRLITDATHPQDQVINMILARMMESLGKSVPFYRAAFTSPAVLETMIRAAGLVDVKIQPLSQHQIDDKEDLNDYVCGASSPPILRTFKIEDADGVFTQATKTWWVAEQLTKSDEIARARQLFEDIWTDVSDADGKLHEVDCVFVGMGRTAAEI